MPISPSYPTSPQVAPRNKDAALKGNGCKLIEVKPTSFTLYSCMHDLERLPSTLADALTSLMRRQEAQPHIFNELVTNEPMFQLHIPHKAFIHEDPEMPRDEQFVTLVNTGIEPIDIPVHTLLLYTNSVDRNQACALLEIAIACSAVQMLVFKSDYWQNATRSQFRGVPVIDTELLLQPISPALVGEQTCFPTPNTMQYDDVNYNIQIQLEQVFVSLFSACSYPFVTNSRRSPSPSPPARRRAHRTWCSPPER